MRLSNDKSEEYKQQVRVDSDTVSSPSVTPTNSTVLLLTRCD